MGDSAVTPARMYLSCFSFFLSQQSLKELSRRAIPSGWRLPCWKAGVTGVTVPTFGLNRSSFSVCKGRKNFPIRKLFFKSFFSLSSALPALKHSFGFGSQAFASERVAKVSRRFQSAMAFAKLFSPFSCRPCSGVFRKASIFRKASN